MINIRTDLAVEAREMCSKDSKGNIEGVEFNEYFENDIKITTVKVINETGEKAMGKQIGEYTTLDFPELTQYDADAMDELSRALAKNLQAVLKTDDNTTTLVVGLGNWNITPDALGPKVVSKLMVTRHLKELVPDSIDEGIRAVCAIAPGVLGLTGMETGEIIKGVVDKIKPNLIICIDALASRKMSRVNSTIQIGNTGISPGSGVGNSRMELSLKSMGIPVIAIGVPTVVDAATMANDTIDLVIDFMIKEASTGSKFYSMLKEIDKNEKEQLIKEILNPFAGNIVVTPKDVDTVIDSLSKIIANGINIALQPALTLNDINRYIN